MTNRSDIPSRIEFQLISTNFPNSGVNEIAGNYTKFNNELVESESFGKRLKNGGFLKEMDALLNSKDQIETTRSIYNHVRNHFEWNGYTALYSGRAGRPVYSDAKGNVADINLTLVALLRNYGIESYPVILSTRGNGTIHPVYPSNQEFNYVIAAAVVDGKMILMDGTSNYVFGTIPVKCRNGNGWLVSENGGKMIDLKNKSNYKIMTTYECEIVDDELKIKATQVFSDYALLSKLRKDSITTVEKFGEGLDLGELEATNIHIAENLAGKALKFTYEITGSLEDELYFQPVLGGSIMENPFKRDSRISVVDFPYSQSYRVITQLKVPEGISVELPESSRVTLPDNKGSFSYMVSNSNNTITVISNLKINQKVFGINDYPLLKQFYQLAADKNQELIVLSK